MKVKLQTWFGRLRAESRTLSNKLGARLWRRLRRHWFVTGFVVVIVGGGLWLAFSADPVDDDARREIGGALVSGGIVAGAVLWFEQDRESHRFEVEQRRADIAAQQAWEREHDMQLFLLVFGRLDAARYAWLQLLHTNRPDLPQADTTGTSSAASLDELRSDLNALIEIIGDETLERTAVFWTIRTIEHERALETRTSDDLVGRETAQQETDSWMEFQTAVNHYKHDRHPSSAPRWV